MAWEMWPYTTTSRPITGSYTSREVTILENNYARILFQPSQDVTLTFYTEGSLDTIGALTFFDSGTEYDPDNPLNGEYLASDDDSGTGNNMSFTYATCTAGTMYAIYVQGVNGQEGNTIFHIEAVPSGSSESWSISELIYPAGRPYEELEDEYYDSGRNLESYGLLLYEMYFAEDGTASFNARSGNGVNIYGYLADSVEIDSDTGEPKDIYRADRTSDRYVEINFDVRTGVAYKFFVRVETGTDSGTVNVTITPPGASPTEEPYFTAEGNSSAGTIYVEVGNRSDIPSSANYYFTVSGRTYEGALYYHTFDNLTDGTYRVRAYYVYNGTDYQIHTQSGETYIDVTIDGGGSGWQLDATDFGQISEFTPQMFSELSSKCLYRFSFSLASDAEVTFYSTGSGDTVAWISDGTQATTWGNTSSGVPDNNIPDEFLEYNDNGGGAYNFSMTRNCVAGRTYYLWFRAKSENGYAGLVTICIDINGGSTENWQYSSSTDVSNVSSETLKTVNVQSYVGVRFRVSFTGNGSAMFRLPSGARGYVYVTDANYGYNTQTGVPYANSGTTEADGGTSVSFNVTSSHGYYYVWVRGATGEVSGGIGVTIIPPGQNWVEINVGNVNLTEGEIRQLQRTMAVKRVYRYNISFPINGKARLYSSGATQQDDIIAYFGTANDGINPSNGVPVSYDSVWNNSSSGGTTNYNFDSGEIDVIGDSTNPQKYYLWVKGIDDTAAPSVVIYIIAPSSTTTTVGFWVFDETIGSSGDWVKLVVNVFDENTGSYGDWLQVKPCIYDYDTGNWIEGT